MNAISPKWLSASSGMAKALIKADMIIAEELAPQNPQKPWILPPKPNGKIFTDGYEKHLSDKANPIKTRESLKGARLALYDLVEHEIEIAPVVKEGRVWADLPAEKIAHQLDISLRHARRLYKDNPFRYAVKILKGVKSTLIRIGPASDLTHEDQARMMAKFWRYTIGRKETPDDFGCLVGLAKDFPQGLALDIFSTVVANWSPYMAGVKIAEHLGQFEGDVFDKNPKNFHLRFLRYPCISLIRRFSYVTQDFYEDAIQEMLSDPKCPHVYSLIYDILNNK